VLFIESNVSNFHESIDAVLAKNLVVARIVLGVTQQELAHRADISRATIAQIETGYSDPRLSTIADLAAALGIPPIILLAGSDDVRAIVDLMGSSPDGATSSRPVEVQPADVERMRRFLRSGMLKDRVRAARVGAAVARSAGAGGASEVCSAIFSAVIPGPGTVAGTRLGRVISEFQPDPAQVGEPRDISAGKSAVQ
jgi:transcriptional regulator with XRE-family HTH domain